MLSDHVGGTQFMADAVRQGIWFENTTIMATRLAGFQIQETHKVFDSGVEVDIVLSTRSGIPIYAFCKGSVKGKRPGSKRSDTVKKAIADMFLLHTTDRGPIILFTSHKPVKGVCRRMLEATARVIPFFLINPITQGDLLERLARADRGELEHLLATHNHWE